METIDEKRYHVLYVDDESGNLRVFQASFKKNFTVFTAASGQEALQVMAENEIHLIITDQKMPRMTGVELLEQVVEHYPHVIRIILTGYSDVEDIIRALNKCGIYRYLVKPWQKDDMLRTLNEALEVYQLRLDRQDLLDELKTANEQLEERIAQRTNELHQINDHLRQEIEIRKSIERHLKDARDKAEEATKAKQLFLSTMSHEIRTPLNAVIGMAHLLQQSELDTGQQENVHLLMFSATNLLALINDILDFSKIEAGKLELEKASFDIKDMLNSIKGIYLSKAKEKGLDYFSEVETSVPVMLVGDATRLGQIMNNLIGNAIKFTERGSVSLKVSNANIENNRIWLKFEIADTGIGIAPEKLELIFEQFSQASSDTTRKYGGSGLGLAITKRLVELQGGEIALESVPGHGSIFSFTLPFTLSKELAMDLVHDSDQAINDALPIDFSHLTILLVEDNAINQILMNKFLAKWKAKYTLAVNGLEALDKIVTKEFDLVLMDIQMPEMDGYEASARIRKMEGEYFQNVPIIALTASTLQGEHGRVKECGMNDYVVKPFDPKKLTNIILKHTVHTSLSNGLADAEAGGDSPHRAQFDAFLEIMEGDMEAYTDLLQATLKDLTQLKGSFDLFVAEGNKEELSKSAHNMKPPIEMMGMGHILDRLREVRNVDGHKKQALTQILQAELNDLEKQLFNEIERVEHKSLI